MSQSRGDKRGPIGFAEKILELLEEGRYTATYKYAVLIALLDVSLEHTERTGARRPSRRATELHGWERHTGRTLSVARAIYFGLPDDARLWLRRREFIQLDRDTVQRALGPS